MTQTPFARVLALRVGRARPSLPHRGRMMHTGFLKDPLDGRTALGPLGFDGDEQGDLRIHGGVDKAVCCYPSEHFPHWRETINPEIDSGAFGENLTLAGLTEADVFVGDTYTLGDAVVQVSQPRGPCVKVAARWRSRTLVRLMGEELRAGWYLRVLEPGGVAVGDTMELVSRVSEVSVAEVLRVTYRDRHDVEAMRVVRDVPELAEQWRGALDSLLARVA